jgi:hypothetical protein
MGLLVDAAGDAPLIQRTNPNKPPPFMSDENKTPAPATNPQIEQANLRTSYANVCRIAQTPNEVIVDFGMNPNFFGNILDEPLKLENRIIMTHDAAKRLCVHLTNTIQSYESKYGPIELDITKRLRQPAG